MSPAPTATTPEHVEEPAPIGGKLITPFTSVLALLVLIMVVVLGFRFVRGIGAVTNLSDGYPWGLWIAWDVVVGSALGASGFTVAFATYMLNRGQYHPMVRPALLTALFGYMMAGASVVFDLGRYWDMWHMFWPKYAQVNSVLFEVGLCIASYTLVLFVEISPAILERLGMTNVRKKMNKILFFFIAVGVLLPTMHQSSLGSMLLVFGPQIDPIYQTRLLPILFLVSTVGMGLAAVTIEGSVTSLSLRRPLERDLIAKLMKVGQALIATFVVLRFADLAYRGHLADVFQIRTLTIMFWIEIALCVGAVVLLLGRGARHPGRVFVAAMLMAFGGILYRLDAYLGAYRTGAGWTYFPSMGELALTTGPRALEILPFIIAIRILPVLPKVGHATAAARA